MRLTGFRGWVGATTVGIVVALLIGVMFLSGIGPFSGSDGGADEQAAGTDAARTDEPPTSRDDRLPTGARPGGQPPAPPAVVALEAITDVPLAPTGSGSGSGGSGNGSSPSQPGNPGGGGGGSGGGGGGDAGVEGEVLSLVNQERAAAGCPAVAYDGPLTGIARDHSADMRDRNFFSHTNPSGQDPWDRAAAAGISNLAAENIAAGQSSPESVMASWMNSSGHRANILNCSLRTLGVGVAYGGSYGIYWTQDFGR